MAELSINSDLGNAFKTILMADDIDPGSEVSYQVCKLIYTYHPLGQKIVDAPIALAQSQQRKISIPDAPETVVRAKFLAAWLELRVDSIIANLARTSRMYGVAAVIMGAKNVDPAAPIDPFELPKADLFFNVLDPLNIAGSVTLDQDPNSPTFQKVGPITVNGTAYHPTRALTLMNESPIYLSYTTSAFGYSGRSVYQRALFPLKSFIRTMIADDMVARKLGLLIAKMKPPGSVVDRLMQGAAAMKRNLLKQGETDQVLGITPEESIETLNMQNVDGAGGYARKNILDNIATATPMPALLLNQETMSTGLADGSEDAKTIVRYVNGVRQDLNPVYKFFDRIVQHRAWTKEFYDIIKTRFPEEYGKVDYTTAFYMWKNSFVAEWPSLIEEPESEKVKVDDIKFKSIISLVEVFKESLPPDQKTKLLQWAADNFNENSVMFTSPLELDWEAIANYEPPQQEGPEGPGAEGDGKEPKAPKPESLQ